MKEQVLINYYDKAGRLVEVVNNLSKEIALFILANNQNVKVYINGKEVERK